MKLFMESNNKIKFTLIVGTVILTVLTIFSFLSAATHSHSPELYPVIQDSGRCL